MKYFDLHCDTITECYNQKIGLKENELQLSLNKGRAIDQWVQTYAIWIDDVYRGEAAYRRFDEMYHYFLSQLEENKEEVQLCCTAEELQKNIEVGKKAAFLAIEGGAAIGGKIASLEEVYQKGVRMMTLTWNGKNEIADGCMVKNAGGITDFGKTVLKKMNELNMLIDVSHLAEKGFWDVEAVTKKAFIATHSNSKTICNHPRNLTDDQFKVFVERGGIVGLNFYPVFISFSKEVFIEKLLPHIDYFLKLGGEKVIAMGSDFDGADMPENLKGIEDISYLYEVLEKEYGKELTERFCYQNAYDFMLRTLR